MALFAYLIIRLFQLVFSVRTVFFSPNKFAGTIFQLIFSAKRTEPICRRPKLYVNVQGTSREGLDGGYGAQNGGDRRCHAARLGVDEVGGEMRCA